MAQNNSTPRKILVFGATGVIGKFIIQELYNARSSFEKIGIFTSPATANNKSDVIQGWEEKGVEIIVADVNSESDIAKAYESLYPPPSTRCVII